MTLNTMMLKCITQTGRDNIMLPSPGTTSRSEDTGTKSHQSYPKNKTETTLRDVIQYKCPAKDTGDEKRNRFHMEDIGGTSTTEQNQQNPLR